MIGIIIAFMMGAFVGIITMCCCRAASQADNDFEQAFQNDKTNQNEKVTVTDHSIRFDWSEKE